MGETVATLLERDGLGGVFFLHGEDAFRRQEAAAALLDAHIEPATRDFNLDVVRGKEVDAEQLASILATPPMMAEFRVVHVKDAQGISSSSTLRSVVVETARTPPPGLALILDADIGSSSAKVWRELKKLARALEFAAVRPEAVPGVLMERARDVLGVTLEEDAATALASAVGSDMGILVQELDKLAAVAGADRPIDRGVVEEAGIRLPAQDRWKWFDLVAEKRFDEAVGGLGILFAQGESGVGLVLWLGQLFLRLGVVLESGPRVLEENLPRNQRWLVRKIAGQARRWRPDEIAAGLDGLLRADRLMKSSSISHEGVVEEWLLARQAAAELAA